MAELITQSGNLIGSVSSQGTLKGKLSMPTGYEDYSGKYEVTPKAEPQTMQTNDKHMTDDVTIKAIPYYEVSNNAGGNTLNIG